MTTEEETKIRAICLEAASKEASYLSAESRAKQLFSWVVNGGKQPTPPPAGNISSSLADYLSSLPKTPLDSAFNDWWPRVKAEAHEKRALTIAYLAYKAGWEAKK